MEKVFEDAKPILEKLLEHGHEAYFVGGAVRDSLLGRPIHDIDIATSAKPQEVQKLFKSVIPVGIEHGTVIVVLNGVAYEVTTFRRESEYKDFRRPKQVAFISNLHEDLKRRDFTINAMALDYNGKLIDPFNGQKDIENKLIRTVGSPYERFQEDPLRMLRAIRFLSQLNFSLEKETYSTIKKMNAHITHLSVERIAQEFEKLMLGQANNNALQHLVQLGLYLYLPCLKEYRKVIEQLSVLNLSILSNASEAWALLLYYMETEPRKILKAWKCSNELMRHVEMLLTELKKDRDKQFDPFQFYQLGRSLSLSYVRLYTIIFGGNLKEHVNAFKKTYEELPIKERKELAVNGKDFLAIIDKKPGPWLAGLLSEIEKAVINKKVQNDKNKLREWGKNWYNQFGKSF
ncbi:CCA tRNA nucleotidyltransferase [Pueribacillus theae]|uniref:CCA-adding enzyme n=1 Tax=Pueribacillus theae TaxID=2171751 RepID=A0A2U1K4C3_9BACI|nr:CCA tRNA nucleotidyltransferase [Pueribacillus theae]PWA12346.1 CCA tRNA nucleotidyltransferase [Pueribacillus theae]